MQILGEHAFSVQNNVFSTKFQTVSMCLIVSLALNRQQVKCTIRSCERGLIES